MRSTPDSLVALGIAAVSTTLLLSGLYMCGLTRAAVAWVIVSSWCVGGLVHGLVWLRAVDDRAWPGYWLLCVALGVGTIVVGAVWV